MNLDFIGNGGAQGDVANAIKSGISIGAMRPFIGSDGRPYISVYTGGDVTKPESYKTEIVTNATLRKDEWMYMDEVVQRVSRERLVGIASLEAKGLVYNLANGMGTTVLEYEEMDDVLNAEMSMDGISRSKNDRPSYTTKYLPIPIIHVDYQINTRALQVSRNSGNALDTTKAEMAARRVSEYLENMLFTNTSYSFGGGTIYSYLNHPDRNTQVLTLNWDSASKTGAQIIADVLAMKQKSIADNHYGPWELYIPTAYETVLDGDYDSTTPGTTIRERIMKIEGIGAIKVVDRLTANNVLLVQMTSDVVRLVKGMGIQNVEWNSEGKFVNNYKVMTIQVPQIRSDQGGKSGIVHLA